MSAEWERRVRQIERRAYVEGYAESAEDLRGRPLSADEREAVEAEAWGLYPDPAPVREQVRA